MELDNNMRKIFFTLIFSFLFYNCSSQAINSENGKIRDYRLTVGLATNEDFLNLANRILTRHRFFVERTENRGAGSVIYCQFIYPELSNDDILMGITEIRSELSLESRVKGSGSAMYNIKAIVRSYGRIEGDVNWRVIQTNDVVKEKVKLIVNDLKTEFENRIRTF